jgi:hypothetical protein
MTLTPDSYVHRVVFTVFLQNQYLSIYVPVFPGLPVIDITYFRRSLFLAILSWNVKGFVLVKD